MKRKCFLFFLQVVTITIIYAKKWTDVGISASTVFYNGDINESKLFYNPSFSQNFFTKFNFNERYSLKSAIGRGSVSANDTDFNNFYQKQRGKTFNSKFWDIALLAEFNFLRYDPYELKKDFISPFVVAGIGFTNGRGEYDRASINIPFGVGIKYKLSPRIGIGAEYTVRKLFTDKLDNLENNTNIEKVSRIHNNDWYTFFTIYVSYIVSNLKINCPTYD